MNLSEFKAGIVSKSQTGKASEAEMSLGTIFNIVNSRPAFASAGFNRVKTASNANYHEAGGYYLLNLAVTTQQRKSWALQLVGQLAVSLGFNPTGLDEAGAKQALDAIVVTGEQAKYAREILNATTAVAITRNSEFILGQFVDVAFDMQLSTATGMQELRFSSISPVKAEIAKASKASVLSIFGSPDELEDNTADAISTSAIVDAL